MIKYDESLDGSIDYIMRIFVRKSLLKYAQNQKKDIFLYTKRSLEFYTKFFQYPNPFDKYDIVFCPEYTIGAMENPGLITYTEKYLFQVDKPSSDKISRRGNTIAHELAHMWFGNLVTMKWWDDLWLKESFADFVCFLCNHFNNPKMPFPTSDAWVKFIENKAWGYREDQLSTTHPIACIVENTSKADSIFDGITYRKGAAVIKQLYFLIGHDKFSENIKDYFESYAWKNATLKEFLKKISQNQDKFDSKAYDIIHWNK